jgi:galactose mutarotase-like enzyme
MASGYGVQMTRVAGMRAWRLCDYGADLHGTWVPGAGMIGASLVHRGGELLWPGLGVRTYVRDRKFMGIPFLHPWANRLGGFSYRAAGREVVLDQSDPLLRLNQGLPIHGVLNGVRWWTVREVSADSERARLMASLEFDRPELLAVFPFRHRVALAVQLSGGAVEIQTTVTAVGEDPVPISFGFHPYLQIPGVPRAQWSVSFPVRRRLVLDQRMIPTGETEPAEPITGPIGERTWDDPFDLIEPGAQFAVHGGGRTIELHYTEGYPFAQLFAPPGTGYLCIEPMTARTNALADAGAQLRLIPAGEQWTATFKIVCRAD